MCMCLIEGETRNFILKFRKIFRWTETVLKAHRMKSDKKATFLSNSCNILRKMVHVVIERYCLLRSVGF